MGHSPSRPNACAAAGAGAGDALPSRFARFRRRLRLHRRRSSGGDDSASKAVAADEFAGIARIRIVKADMRFKDRFFACLSLGERTYRTETSDNTYRPVWDSEKKVIVETNGPHIARISVFETNRFSKSTLVGYCEVDLFEILTKDLDEHSEDLPLLDPSSPNTTVGSITISCYIEDPVETEQSFARRVLAIVDYNEDGTLSLSEFSDLMKAFGNNLAVAKIEELFRQADTNGDGIVDIDELAALLANQQEKEPLISNCPVCGEDLGKYDKINDMIHMTLCFDEGTGNQIMTGGFLTDKQASYGWMFKLSEWAHFSTYDVGLHSGSTASHILVFDRRTKRIVEEVIDGKIVLSMRALYQSKVGLTLINTGVKDLLKNLSEKQGKKMDSQESAKDIPKFLESFKDQINMDEVKDPIESFKTFNEFFIRKLKPGARPIAFGDQDGIATCAADSRLMAFSSVDESTRLWIKGRKFSIEGLLGTSVHSDALSNGSLVIFRLAPQDYHRFHVPVSGTVEKFVEIPGCLYTVNPIAVNSKYCNVFTENKRVISIISTSEFGKVAFVAIGATMVGSINFMKQEGDHVRKGDDILQNSEPSSRHGAHHRQGKEPEVEEGDKFQIPCSKVFKNIKHALSINGKASSKAPQHKAQPKAVNNSNTISKGPQHNAQPRAVNEMAGYRARILRWGVCFRCLNQGHHVRQCKGNFRCMHCFNFGHRAQNCIGKKATLKWAPKHTRAEVHASINHNGKNLPEIHASAHLNYNASPETCSSPPIETQPSSSDQYSSPTKAASSQSLPNSDTPVDNPPSQQDPQPEEEEDMAAFDIEPERFIPTGMEVEDGGPNRRQRATVCFSGAPSRRHEDYAIAVTDEILTPAQRLAYMHEVRDYIRVVARRHVISYSPHPHGIGIFCFQSACDRDNLVHNSPHWIGNRNFSLVNHDEAMNCRRSLFARVGWVMLAGYPLDYKEPHFIHQACTPIGRVLQWHSNDTSKARLLVKVLIENIANVPRVLKLKSGRALDGEGRAWLTRVFVLNSQFADQIIDDDEDFPHNGNNNNGGNGNNNEAVFVANLADLHQQQQEFAQDNQNNQNGQQPQAEDQGEDSNNSSVNQASMEDELFLPGVGHQEEVIIEEPQSAQISDSEISEANMVELRKLDDKMQDIEIGSEQQNNISESCPDTSNSMVPAWAQMFANSLKTLIQNMQQNQEQCLKQSVLFDTPTIKLNMIGSSIESIQFLARPTEQAPRHNNTRHRTTAANNMNRLSVRLHPIRKFYVRKIKQNNKEEQEQQSFPPLLNTGDENIPTKKKRKATTVNEKISEQSLRRSIRLSKKYNGYKNRNILESDNGDNYRGSKKRKVTSPKELGDKIMIPVLTQSEEFPGLADIEGPEPYPEIGTNLLQKVAINRCGISPLEVTTELLLAIEEGQDMMQDDGSGSNKITVINE